MLDSEHPGELDCTPDQARELVLWLHHLPSYEHLLVGCHRHRPPENRIWRSRADRPHSFRNPSGIAPTSPARPSEFNDAEAIFDHAVVGREPDADVADGPRPVAALPRAAEVRAKLARAGAVTAIARTVAEPPSIRTGSKPVRKRLTHGPTA